MGKSPRVTLECAWQTKDQIYTVKNCVRNYKSFRRVTRLVPQGRARSQFLTPVDLPFYSATIIQVRVREAVMATRRKAKGKARGKRKKAPVTKAATRKKAARKARTTSKKPAKRISSRSASPKKAEPTAKTTVKPPPQSASREQRSGVVTHYYSHLSVATMRLEPGTTLHVGDVIHIHGHTTDFTQKVESLEVGHAPVTEVGPNDDFGLKVIAHAREHDAVFKVRS